MVNNKIKKVIGYVRISSDSQIENTSIAEQKDRIFHHCKAQGWELDQMFVDEGYSGSNTDRPGYQTMIEYLKLNPEEIHGVVVYKMDRAHRDQLNLLKFIKEELAEMEVDFVSVTESFDTSTAIGEVMLGILSTFAQFERRTINERTRGGRVATAKSNKYAGGRVPFGYKAENGRIKIVEEQAKVVKSIFEDFIDGDSFYKIAKRLNKEGVSTKSGAKWTVNHIKSIINNETYTGFSQYSGKKERNEIKQKGVFPRIISRQKWNKVQSRLKEKEEVK